MLPRWTFGKSLLSCFGMNKQRSENVLYIASAGGTHFLRGREEVQSKDLGVCLSHDAKDKSVHRKRGRGWLFVLCVCWYRVSDWSRNLSRFLLATLELENG